MGGYTDHKTHQGEATEADNYSSGKSNMADASWFHGGAEEPHDTWSKLDETFDNFGQRLESKMSQAGLQQPCGHSPYKPENITQQKPKALAVKQAPK
ncbi:Hypothetical predicted protein [Pelobates cultripes]|uniref:Uncharacterized protein n=1 Tax=Pelobates cultripes TaxID=61616 RepID=A0AAD1RNW0_PELCU|nr:Hypothetical predicted protein [Pelobates cultripes]